MKVVDLGILMMSSTFGQFSNYSKLVYTKTTTCSRSAYVIATDLRHQQIHANDGTGNYSNDVGAKFNLVSQK